jgi:hypothetical protein
MQEHKCIQHETWFYDIGKETAYLKLSSVTGMSGSRTGDSGSNPERAPCRWVLLVVDDLNKENLRDMKAVMSLRILSLGRLCRYS